MKAMKHGIHVYFHAQAAWFIFSILTAISSSISAPSPDTDQTIILFMNDVLGNQGLSEAPLSSNSGHHRYSPDPANFSSPKSRVPFHHPTAGRASGSSSASWLPFLGRLQALEPGKVIVIDEELIGGSQLKGKVQGVFVMSSENNSSSMVAMKATFNGINEESSTDSLRFFGLYQPSLNESHIAVIGGTGRYQDANGFAVFRSVPGPPSHISRKVLLFTVYLK
ncbi:hypothetical protein J5N97_002306 [Dioscorea zingiberensis]|uniref:Dirigent protein n=1 Tax=Dioscorea zingiberensis TaxID=325984 RepID=A0A9D5D4J0_9LILI|nr:hypothetical protein J5N97_002306 [Dioscorea zingiberensis]